MQILRELEWPVCALFKLPGDGALIPFQSLALRARPHLAALYVEQQVHFPPLETVALQFSPQQFAEKAVKARRYDLAGQSFFNHNETYRPEKSGY
ncbi:MAG: hypothetical protein ABJF23_15615 [Bryobacteraceae bacterium]